MRPLWTALALLCLAGPALAQQQGDGAAFTTLKGHGGPIMGIAVTPDGRVATASFDNSVGQWTGRTPRWREGHDAAVTALVARADGSLVSGGDDFRVLAWDARGMREIHTHQGKVRGLAARPGLIASASWDGTVAVHRPDAPAQVLTGHTAGVNAVAFASDSALYSAASDGTIRLWDLETGQGRVVVSHGFGINRLVLDAAAGWLAYGAVDGVTRVIDLALEQEIRDLSLDRRPILAMAHHAATGQLAVGDGEGYIMMIDTARWRIMRDFRATRQGPVWALAFSRDGGMIYAGGLDDVAYGWPVEMLGTLAPGISGARSFLRDPETMSNGERQFMRKCSICHATEPGPSRKAGPTLAGIFGRAAGAVPGYPYSPVLRDAAITWDATSIDALFDAGPDHYIPGSRMPMQVIAAPQDRADLISWLKTATQPDQTRESPQP
jgi:cytochrome c